MCHQAHCLKEHFMADDPNKNPNQQSGQQGQNPEQRQRDQQDPSKRNPTPQNHDEELDQQTGQRRAS
jgi:hypothetical protein